MAVASLILVLAASVLVVTCAARNIKTTSSATSSSHSNIRLSSHQKCVKVKKCPKNEEFSICTQSIGRAQFCSQKGQTLRHQKDKPICTEGCVCKYKFLRNNNGTCIPERECNTDCSTDEILDDCPVDCPSDNCPISDERSLRCPRPDSDECPPAVCKCGFNRRRAVNGTCIFTIDCPPVDCSARPFEEYVACPPLCPTDDCSQASENGRCPNKFGNIFIILPCNPTCRCIKDYWRKNGICVPYDECNIPTSCPANEEVRCVNECPPERTCDNRGIEYDCAPPVNPCENKCVCKEGYVRNSLGTCITEDKCDIPTSCPANEEVRCVNKCPPERTCENRGIEYDCVPTDEPCENKCVCKKGYFRNSQGTCITKDKCDIPTSCPVHEEVRCVNKCPPERTCKNRCIQFKCAAPVDPCENKCVCKKGYFRNYLGTCITDKECDKCKGNNEFFACDSACDNECSKLHEQNRTNCPIQTFVPVCQCYCEDGFARNKHGKCVPVEKCHKPTSCPVHEEVRCVNECPPERTCKNRGIQFNCATPVDPCENKCVCKKGYYRNSRGTCITEDKCDKPMSCPANEEVHCVNKCPPELTCKTRGRLYKCAAPVDPCENKCVCKEGYFRNSQGTCIAEDKCDIPTLCQANEEVRCVDKCPPERTCKTRDLQYRCTVPVDPCKYKCVCKEGFFRNFLGTCITDKECDLCSGDNEFFACDSACDNECSKIPEQNRTNCPILNIVCNRKCYCEDGFARDNDRNCVPVEECPNNSCPDNEEYVPCIQGVCRAMNCSQKGESVPCPDRKWPEEECDAGCICKENYLRNEDGTCVPEDQCETQPEPTCGDNEVLDKCPSDCPSDYCPTCAKDNKKCPRPEPCPPPECKCRFNFRRSDNGSCIPTRNCPPFDCKAKPNEQWTPCPPLCPSDTCSLARVRGVCPFRIGIVLECNPKCQCTAGYGRVTSSGKCVPYEDCPDLCPANEEYNSCTQAVCRNQNCTDKDGPVFCPRIDPAYCIKGCVCKENYYRSSNGTCVAYDECDADLCPLNEEYNSCTQTLCRPQNCSNRFKPKPCPTIKPSSCKTDCVCKPGYFRNDNGTCVIENECVDKQCPNPNEKYALSRQPSCPALGTCLSISASIQCDKPESLGCICKDGFLRDDKTLVCIPICKCPEMASSPDCKKKVSS